MTRTTQEKAKDYVLNSAVTIWRVDYTTALAEVQGSAAEPYRVVFEANTGWECNCPAYTECAHILAVRLVTPHLLKTTEPTLFKTNSSLSDFLNSL